MREITKIIVHCSATKPSMNIGLKEIKAWHTDPKPKGRGWSDVGYHYIIRRDGFIEVGRHPSRPGAHARGFNDNSIGVCLVGGMAKDGLSDANFTVHQYVTLLEVLNRIRDDHPNAEVLGHRDLPKVAKDCPCFDVKSFYNFGEN